MVRFVNVYTYQLDSSMFLVLNHNVNQGWKNKKWLKFKFNIYNIICQVI